MLATLFENIMMGILYALVLLGYGAIVIGVILAPIMVPYYIIKYIKETLKHGTPRLNPTNINNIF